MSRVAGPRGRTRAQQRVQRVSANERAAANGVAPTLRCERALRLVLVARVDSTRAGDPWVDRPIASSRKLGQDARSTEGSVGSRFSKTSTIGSGCGGEILVSRAILASAGGHAPMQAVGATRRSTGRRSGERWRTRSRRLGSVTGLGPSRSLQVQANGLFTHRPFGPRFSAATRACRAKNPAMAAATLRRRSIAERSSAPWSRGSCLVGFVHPPQPAP